MPNLPQISQLYQEFLSHYPESGAGRRRLALLVESRGQAVRNYRAVQELREQGAASTAAILHSLLPHADTPANRAAGTWIHPAPAVSGELRRWSRHAGRTDEGWLATADALWTLIQWCVEVPQELAMACSDFAGKPAATGFQSATLSPLLNALCPQHFHLVNGRIARVIQHFSGLQCSTRIAEYAQAVAVVEGFLKEQHDLFSGHDQSRGAATLRAADLFESFCHWLVSVRRYIFPTTCYWSVGPTDEIEWQAWQAGGFVALAHPDIDDLSSFKRREFDRLRDRLVVEKQTSKRMLNDLWRFAHRVQDGDGLVVERDGQVWGIGTVAGHYYYVPDEEIGHCLPVVWDDLQARAVPQRARRQRPFVKLKRATFEQLRMAEPLVIPESFGRECGLVVDTIANAPASAANIADADNDVGAVVRENTPPYPSQSLQLVLTSETGQAGDSHRQTSPPISLAEIVASSGFPEDRLSHWISAIERKGQAIFYGPPGTGKTYMSMELARHLVGGGDGFYELVQFHPSYAYEEFVQGLRPVTQDGQLRYRLTPGRFLNFCQAARQCQDRCLLLVDEINRADIARVFGELMHGLEYRGQAIPLAAGGSLTVPVNVRLLGTMNTADRSIALLDYALRRRFAFLHLQPEYDILRHFFERTETGLAVAPLIDLLTRINRAIDDPNYALGITFFLRPHLEQEIEAIWCTEILPYLEEVFFDRPAHVEAFRWEQIASRLLGEERKL